MYAFHNFNELFPTNKIPNGRFGDGFLQISDSARDKNLNKNSKFNNKTVEEIDHQLTRRRQYNPPENTNHHSNSHSRNQQSNIVKSPTLKYMTEDNISMYANHNKRFSSNIQTKSDDKSFRNFKYNNYMFNKNDTNKVKKLVEKQIKPNLDQNKPQNENI